MVSDFSVPIASNRQQRVGRAFRIFGQTGKLRVTPREPLHFLAATSCVHCAGTGFKKKITCPCVYRRVSRIALDRLFQIQMTGPRVNWHAFSRDAEYAVDLRLIAKRTLEPFELVIWDRFLVERRPWNQFTAKPGRGQFFHDVYRTEQKYGAALIATECFPPSVYFCGLRKNVVEPIVESRYFWRDSGAEDMEPRLDLSGDDSRSEVPSGISENGPGGASGAGGEDQPQRALPPFAFGSRLSGGFRRGGTGCSDRS